MKSQRRVRREAAELRRHPVLADLVVHRAAHPVVHPVVLLQGPRLAHRSPWRTRELQLPTLPPELPHPHLMQEGPAEVAAAMPAGARSSHETHTGYQPFVLTGQSVEA